MSTLFISHSSSDNTAARELSRRLAQPPRNHHSVFLDLDPEHGIVAGQSWEQTLYRKLRSCRAVIALITEPYLGSQWCFAEIALARMEGKHIFALLTDPLSHNAKLPGILTEKQFIDLRQDPEDGYRRLWKGLEELDLLGVAGEWDPKESPYLGLRAYQEKHAGVFFGRGVETRAGIELLERGAPGLIMVLGSSGSGKSSLVRAGMLPRLRRDTDRWLLVDPFRPRRDPVAELAESLAAAYRRYAPDRATRRGSRDRIREKLEAGLPLAAFDDAEAATEGAGEQSEPASGADDRLLHLLRKTEELRESPPDGAGPPVMEFLDWSLDDLRRICRAEPLTRIAAAATPGSLPLVEIAEHLRRASGNQNARVLLIIDQFEELLGNDEPRDRTHRFLRLLRESVELDHSPLMALGTMRSDFLGLFQRNLALREIDFESLSVGPMSVDALRRVIEEPAKLGAIELEQGLADRLLEDTETPDALPLLSFTLWRLWEDRKDGKLTVGQYEALGGLHGAVAREAEAVLGSARKQGQEDDVRAAFLQMARITEDGSYARHPVSWDREELQKVKPILESFEQRRLLVTRQDEGESSSLEVAHEALFRSWPPLKTWLDNSRAELLLKQQLRRDATVWDDHDRAADNLWRGGRLQQAGELLRKGGLPPLETQFVQVGLRRRRIRLLAVTAVLVAVIGILAGFLAFALAQKEKALQALRVAVAWDYLDKDPLVSVAFLGEVDDPESLRGWRGATSKVFDTLGISTEVRLKGADGEPLTGILGAEFDPSTTRIVTASRDGTAQVWNLDGTPAAPPMEYGGWWGTPARFTPDGSRVYAASWDAVSIWEAETAVRYAELRIEATTSVSSSPDATLLLTTTEHGTVQLWESRTGQRLWDSGVHHEAAVTSATFSLDGQSFVTASEDMTARLWSLDSIFSGDPMRDPLKHDDAVVSADFSPDGRYIITAARDERVRIWPLEGGAELVYDMGGEELTAASFSPDASLVLTASGNIVQLWTQGRHEQPPESLQHEAPVRSAGFTPTGRHVLTASGDGKARLWTIGGVLDSVFDVFESDLESADISPDGRKLVAVSSDGEVAILDLLPEVTQLQEQLWAQEANCLDAEKRSELLGQSASAAKRDFQACRERTKLPAED